MKLILKNAQSSEKNKPNKLFCKIFYWFHNNVTFLSEKYYNSKNYINLENKQLSVSLVMQFFGV